ncbi:PAS domain-containing protein [Methylomagnum sp.]
MAHTNTMASLRAENRALRTRLEQAEALIRAIRAGEKADACPHAELAECRQVELSRLELSRSRRDEELRESERRWRQLAEAMPQLVWTCAPEGQCDYLSAQWVDYTGLTGAEQLGYRWLEQVHPEDHERLLAAWHESVASGKLFTTEFRIRRADGAWRWFLTRATPVRDARGRIVKWYGSNSDIEDIKRTQTELRERAERYELILAGAQDAIWDWDIPNRRVQFSPRWKTLRGHAENEIGGSEEEWREGIHPDDAQRVFAGLQDHLEGKTPVFVEEYRVRCKDGSWKWVLDRGLVQRDAVGQAIRMAGSESDITERKQAEESLRESESFYRQTLESIPGMVFTTRPDGYCDYQSQQWVDYTGIPMTEHLGDGWNTLLHPEDRPRAFAAWQAAVEGVAPYDLEYRVRRHDGAYEWFRVMGRPIRDAAGRIVRWFGVAMNIEALQRARAALRDSEERIRLALEVSHTFAFEWEPARPPFSGSIPTTAQGSWRGGRA